MLRLASMFFDLVVAVAAFFAAYATVYSVRGVFWIEDLPEKAAIFTIIAAISYYLFSVQRGSWRYVSIPDLLALLKAAAFATATYTIVSFLTSRGVNLPRSVPILLGFYLVAGLAGARLVYRLLVEGRWISPFRRLPSLAERRHVILLGVTPEAESFVRSVTRAQDGIMNVAGILDDAGSVGAQSVQGIKVHGGLDRLEELVRALDRSGVKVSELIVTERLPSRQRLSQILEVATAAGVRVTRVPDLTNTSSITSGALLEPRPIELGDLLGRPEIAADVEGVARLINGKVVLITGAAGSIGSELCRQVAGFWPKRLVVADNSEFHLYELDKDLRESEPGLPIVTRIVDVRDALRVNSIFREFQPEVVFHAAALKHVPLVEDNPIEAIKTNLFGTRNVANAALENQVSAFVMISTDKAVNPTNVMGATKRAAEVYCQALDVSSEKTRFKTVRFGNVLGSNGSVVPRFREQIAAGGPVTVTHPEIVRFFMTIPEAVRLVLHASAQALKSRAERGKIMVLDMGQPVKILDLAERMIQLAGFKPRVDIDIIFTGLRPGEKLYEELFDPSEVQDEKTEEGYVVASPRIIDRAVLGRCLDEIRGAVEREDRDRAITTLRHIVPEYRPEPVPGATPGAGVAQERPEQSPA